MTPPFPHRFLQDGGVGPLRDYFRFLNLKPGIPDSADLRGEMAISATHPTPPLHTYSTRPISRKNNHPGDFAKNFRPGKGQNCILGLAGRPTQELAGRPTQELDGRPTQELAARARPLLFGALPTSVSPGCREACRVTY